MAQIKTVTWTNPAAAVAKNIDLGFDPCEAYVVDTTNGGVWQWIFGMANASFITVATGAITLGNGFTPLDESGAFGALLSGFTNANPGVITGTRIADSGFAIGDTFTVGNLADDRTGTTLNGTYKVAAVTATTITTATDTTAFSVYSSGGEAVRVKDSTGTIVATANNAIRGMTLGTGVVGGNNAVMVAVFKSQVPVL